MAPERERAAEGEVEVCEDDGAGVSAVRVKPIEGSDGGAKRSNATDTHSLDDQKAGNGDTQTNREKLGLMRKQG